MTAAVSSSAKSVFDRIAHTYDDDMGRSMPFADAAYYAGRACERPSAVLELGCGTGRITQELMRSGLQVAALDVSSKMLEVLRTRAVREPEAFNRGALNLIQADVRTWPLRSQFSTILCPYSFITYMITDRELEDFLSNVRICLLLEGQFVVDAFVPAPGLRYCQWIRDYRRVLSNRRVLHRWKRIEQESARINVVQRHYRIETACGSVLEEFTVVDRLRWFQPEELRSILSSHGFVVARTDWDYHAGQRSPEARFVTFGCTRTP